MTDVSNTTTSKPVNSAATDVASVTVKQALHITERLVDISSRLADKKGGVVLHIAAFMLLIYAGTMKVVASLLKLEFSSIDFLICVLASILLFTFGAVAKMYAMGSNSKFVESHIGREAAISENERARRHELAMKQLNENG